MKKGYIRRAVALSMVGVMMLSGAATGCGKKKVDYNIDGENSGSGSGSSGDSGELRAKVKAPKSYTGDIPVGDSGLSSIKIDAKKISIPDASTMSIVSCEPLLYTSDYKKQLVEGTLDKSKGIYKFSYEKQVREDVQKDLDMYQTMLEDANAAGDTENAQWISDTVNSLKSDLANATDSRDPAGDVYDGEDYVGYIGDQMFETTMYSAEGTGAGGTFNLSHYPYSTIKDIRPYENYYNVSYYPDETSDMENMSDMSKEEAISFATSYLADMGFKDIALKSCSNLVWDYFDYAGNTKAEECDGWAVTFVKAVDNVPIYNPDIWNVDYLDTNNVWYSDNGESLSLNIYDGKVISAYIDYSLKTVSEENDVELLSWDDILKSAQEKIPEFYKDNKTSYMDIVFDYVKLTYYKVKDEENPGNYKLVPAWAFISSSPDTGETDGTETSTEEENEILATSYPAQLILINAVDGSLIDVAAQLNSESVGGEGIEESYISDQYNDTEAQLEKEIDAGDMDTQ